MRVRSNVRAYVLCSIELQDRSTVTWTYCLVNQSIAEKVWALRWQQGRWAVDTHTLQTHTPGATCYHLFVCMRDRGVEREVRAIKHINTGIVLGFVRERELCSSHGIFTCHFEHFQAIFIICIQCIVVYLGLDLFWAQYQVWWQV